MSVYYEFLRFQKLQGDVRDLHSTLKQHQLELKTTESKMKENMTKAEDVR
jgi:hypothetical protein